jgi:hypothetical protein
MLQTSEQVMAAAGAAVNITLCQMRCPVMCLWFLPTLQLQVGDILYLLRYDGSYVAGFKLQQQQQHQDTPLQQQTCSTPSGQAAPEAADQAATDEPAAKRHKAATTSHSPSSPASAGGQQESPTRQGVDIGPFSNVIAAAAHAGAPVDESTGKHRTQGIQEGSHAGPAIKHHPGRSSEGANEAGQQQQQQQLRSTPQPQQQQHQQQQQQLFSGVQLLDWDGHHTALALRRATELGATVSQVADDTITHIIAR